MSSSINPEGGSKQQLLDLPNTSSQASLENRILADEQTRNAHVVDQNTTGSIQLTGDAPEFIESKKENKIQQNDEPIVIRKSNPEKAINKPALPRQESWGLEETAFPADRSGAETQLTTINETEMPIIQKSLPPP